MPFLRLAFRLGLRDLRGGLGALRILVAGIALGVAAIALVGTLAGALLEGVREGARETVGGDVSLRLFHRPPDAAERAFLAAAGDYAEIVELRTRAARADGTASTLVELKAVDAVWPLYGVVGLGPPAPLAAAFGSRDGLPGAVVDAALLDALGLAVGDPLRLGTVTVRVAAVLTAEPGRGLRPFTLGPRVLVARSAIEGTPLLRSGAPVYWYGLVRFAPEVDRAAWLRDLDRRFPDAGWRVIDAADGVPGLERTVQIARVLLTFAGLAVLLIGGVGVAAAVRAHLAHKTRTIAVLRSLGAGGGLVAAVCLVQVGAAAGLAVALGLLAGAGAAAALVALLGDLPWGAAPVWQLEALVLAAAFGLLGALLFALPALGHLAEAAPQRLFRDLVAPVPTRSGRWLAASAAVAAGLFGLLLGATSMPMLATVFALGALAVGMGFVALGHAVARLAGALARRLGTGPTVAAPGCGARRPMLRLALGSLSRPGAGTVPVVTALGLALTVVVAVATIEGNARRHLAETVPRAAPDLVFVDVPAAEAAAFDTMLGALPAVERHRRMPFLHARLTHMGDRRLDPASVPRDVAWVVRGDRGLSWSPVPPPAADIVAGAWWPADHAGPPLASIDAKAAARLGIGVGDRITLDVHGRPWTATVANLRRIDWSRLGLDFPILLSPPADPPPHGHLAAVWVGEGAGAIDAVEAAVSARFPGSPAVRIAPVLAGIADMVATASTALGAASAAVAAAAVAVLAGSLAAGYRQRMRDVVLLRMLGASRGGLVLAAVIELLLLGLAAIVVAVPLGTAIAHAVVTEIAPGGWVWQPRVPLAAAAAAAAGAVVAGWLLPRRALAVSPSAWLRRFAA